MTLIDALQEYQDGEIWAQRNQYGDLRANSPAKIVPAIGDPKIDLENFSYVCTADHTRPEELKLSATGYDLEADDNAIYYANNLQKITLILSTKLKQ